MMKFGKANLFRKRCAKFHTTKNMWSLISAHTVCLFHTRAKQKNKTKAEEKNTQTERQIAYCMKLAYTITLSKQETHQEMR